VSSGVENVVLIGCSDIVVNESNVSYVNNVPQVEMISLNSPITVVTGVTSYNITVLDGTLLVETGATDTTINLTYTLSQYAYATKTINYLGTNYDVTFSKIVNIKKIDSGLGKVILDPTGSATIDGASTQTLYTQYDNISIQYDGTNWHII